MNQIEPYVGPRPFQRIDEAVFFGREKEASEVLSLIIANPVLLLYARSGAGKTSLLNAKVMPMLEREELSVLPTARVQGHIPTDLDLNTISNANVYVFNALMSWQTTKENPSAWATQRLADFFTAPETASEAAPRVLIFDQFEELFTSYPDRWADRHGFFRQISELMEGSPLFLRAEDFTDLKQLAEDLCSQEQPVSQILWPRLSAETQQLASTTNGAGIAPEFVKLLLKDMNQIIEGDSIYDQTTFSKLPLRTQTSDFLRKGLSGKDAATLNRLLIEDAFPNLIRRRVEGDPLLRVVFSMREDFIAELDPYAAILPNRLRVRYRLEPLRRAAALLSVTGPLEKTNLHFASGVAEQLVDNLLKIPARPGAAASDIAGEFVEPVQLQVVCQGLWENVVASGETEITEEDLRTHGDVDRALRRFYEKAITKVIQTHNLKEWSVRSWFEEVLITTAGTRGMVFRSHETTGGLNNAIVDELEDQHIIRAELRGGERWYELSHDRFIQPIRDSNNDWRLARSGAITKRRELEAKAVAWMHAGGRESLLDESAAIEAQRWIESDEATEIGFSKDLFAFVQSSRLAVAKAARKREREIFERDRAQAETIAQEQRQRAEAERQRAEEQERRAEAERLRAEEQGKRAEAEARATARMRRLAAAMAVVCFLAVGAAGFALVQRTQAKRSETQARNAEAQARQAETESNKQRKLATEQYLYAQNRQTLAEAETKRANEEAQKAIKAKAAANENAEEAKKQSLIASEKANLARRESERANRAALEAIKEKAAAELAREDERKAKESAQKNEKIAKVALEQSVKDRETIAKQLEEIKKANQIATDAKTADELNTSGRDLEAKGNLEGAIASYQKAYEIYVKTDDLKSQADALQRIGFVYHRKREDLKAIETSNRVLQMRRQLRDRSGEADALHFLAMSHQNSGKNRDAIELYKQALSVYVEVGNPGGQFESLMGLAGSSFNQSDYEQATSLTLRAQQIANQIERQTDYPWLVPRTYSMLGTIYNQEKQYVNALQSYERALAIYEKDQRRKAETAETLTAIGHVYQRMGDDKKALSYFERARVLQPQSPAQRQ